MGGRGRRRQWDRVVAARERAQAALGRVPTEAEPYSAPVRRKAAPPPSPAPQAASHGAGVGVLTVGEAATRLGMSRAQLEAMIARSSVETLPIEFGCVIPTSEVERLLYARK
jgi:hypothetical protein